MTEKKILLVDYVGEIEGRDCSICKLELRSKQEILQCPFCKYLFHEEHINEWLENHNDCPVCNKIIQYEVSEKTLEKIKVKSSTLALPTSVSSFYNPHYPKRFTYFFIRTLISITGLVMIVLPILLFILAGKSDGYTDENGPYFFALIITPFVLTGIAMIIVPNLKFFSSRYAWKSITIIENGILIERRKFPRKIKLDSKSIRSIELEQYFGSKIESRYKNGITSINSKIQFHIRFRINLIDNDFYYIKSICQLDTESESNEIFLALLNRLEKLYDLKIITPFISKRK